MNEHEQPAFWPAQGNLHQGRVFVLKEDVIFTVLAQEGGFRGCMRDILIPAARLLLLLR